MANASGETALETAVVDMPAPRTSEHPVRVASGFVMLGVATGLDLAGIALLVVGIVLLAAGAGQGGMWVVIASSLMILLGLFMSFGLTAGAPGEARVVQLLGRYVGTLRAPGFQRVNPITVRRGDGRDEGQRRDRGGLAGAGHGAGGVRGG